MEMADPVRGGNQCKRTQCRVGLRLLRRGHNVVRFNGTARNGTLKLAAGGYLSMNADAWSPCEGCGNAIICAGNGFDLT
jgi:hypothetical protein